MDVTTLPAYPVCEPDMTVPLRGVASVGPTGSHRSYYATCEHCRREFVPDTSRAPLRCLAPRT